MRQKLAQIYPNKTDPSSRQLCMCVANEAPFDGFYRKTKQQRFGDADDEMHTKRQILYHFFFVFAF